MADFSPTGEPSSSSNFFSEFNLTREQTIQLIGHLNGTMNEYAKCLVDKFAPPILGGCKSDFDGLLCWNATESNTLAVLPCLPEIKGIKYNTSRKFFLVKLFFYFMFVVVVVVRRAIVFRVLKHYSKCRVPPLPSLCSLYIYYNYSSNRCNGNYVLKL